MKKTQIISLIVAAVMIFACFNILLPSAKVTASSEIVTPADSEFTYRKFPVNEPTQIYITGYTGSDKKINIPEAIEGIPVTRILGGVFTENENIEYIRIPAGVTAVVARGFILCSSLTVIDVDPQSPYFTSVDGVLYNKDKTSLIAFPAGKGGSFTVPESVVSIGNYAFESCYNLTDVKMYNNVLTVGQNAFSSCWNLSSIKLSDNLQTLGYRALAFCDSLTEIHLPGSLKNIGEQAVIGGIDSDSNWYYNFLDGLYYVPGTESAKYVKTLHVPTEYLIGEPRSVTDISTGVKILDPNNILPTDGNLEFKATVLPEKDFASLIPVRYAYARGYNLSLKNNGASVTLKKDIVLNFDGTSENPNPIATKLYTLSGSTLQQLMRSPNAPFTGTQTKTLGKYIVAENTDFSLKGDIDGDGVVTTYDTQIALSIAAKLVKNITDEQLATANADGKAGITTEDARKILRYASGME